MNKSPKIFIVGNSRSGTTMLGRMLNNHPEIYTFDELHFFEQMVDAATITGRPQWNAARLQKMVERLLTSARQGLFKPLTPGVYSIEATAIVNSSMAMDPISVYEKFLYKEASRMGGNIPCEQTPRYLYHAEEILEAFPDAKIVCMVRDPRPVLLSQKNKWQRRKLGASNMPLYWVIRSWANYHPYTIACMWTSASRQARRLREHPRFHVIRFEDIAALPKESVQDICDFIGIEFDERMLSVAQIGSSNGLDRPDQIGVDASRVGTWRKGGLRTAEIEICERVAANEMTAWGYEPDGNRASLSANCLEIVSLIFKSALALMFNLRRSRNIIETVRRRFR